MMHVMDQWYFNDSGQQRGPVGSDEIRSLLAKGSLQTDTLLWTEGMTEWKPAGEISAFQASPYAPPISNDLPEADWSGYEASGSQIRPWVRYWARTFDYLTFCMLVGVAAVIIWPEIEEMNDTLLGVLLLVLYNFVEPLMLSTIGTTPFKALLRIRVRNNDGSKPSYFNALSRTFSVWIRGQGLGIPIAALVTSIMSYSRLSNDGITSWDQSGGFTVSHQTIQWWRWLVLFLIPVGFVALIIVGSEV
jgi:hypothetical protein